MIRKLCYLLFGILVALCALKAITAAKARRASTPAPVPPSAEETATPLAGKQPYAGHDPISGRDGYCLDVIHRIFPQAILAYDEHPTDAQLIAHVADSPECALVTLGRHPDLQGFPQSKTPIAHYTITVISPRKTPWRYTGPESLESIRLAYSRTYLDAPLVAEHWARHKDDPKRALLLPDDTSLAAARWDADNTNLVLRDDFRDAGPIQQVPLFLTLSPKNPSAPAILEEFEQGMARLRADGTLDRLHALYFPSDATARKAP